jgi:hypothetical protein
MGSETSGGDPNTVLTLGGLEAPWSSLVSTQTRELAVYTENTLVEASPFQSFPILSSSPTFIHSFFFSVSLLHFFLKHYLPLTGPREMRERSV